MDDKINRRKPIVRAHALTVGKTIVVGREALAMLIGIEPGDASRDRKAAGRLPVESKAGIKNQNVRMRESDVRVSEKTVCSDALVLRTLHLIF